MKGNKGKILAISGIYVILVAALIAIAIVLFGGKLPEDSKILADNNPFLAETGYAKPEVKLDGVLLLIWTDL